VKFWRDSADKIQNISTGQMVQVTSVTTGQYRDALEVTATEETGVKVMHI